MLIRALLLVGIIFTSLGTKASISIDMPSESLSNNFSISWNNQPLQTGLFIKLYESKSGGPDKLLMPVESVMTLGLSREI
ncbi:hypothetical protein [Thalassotalea sp. PLHSN55]|uniref:hypothetical protein n=1 Tax=Thalassotalea sp. PLHSN55 TaxID=3435888 RepID=UPI003F824489